MAWLGTWAKRIMLTIDYHDLPGLGTLNNFPLLVYLSAASGLNNKDLTAIFTSYNTDRKKIAVTIWDGVTQCYVEIERWEKDDPSAELWVLVPNIDEVNNTILYLYYDPTQPDNDTYVGDKNSTPAEAVWDVNYVGVYHLDEVTGGANAIKDSTVNHNDGTDSGGATFDQVGVGVWKSHCIDFDGIDGKIDLGDPAAFDDANITVEAWVKTTMNLATDGRIVQNSSADTNQWMLGYAGTNDTGVMSNSSASHATPITDTVINDDAWHHLVGTTNPEAIYMDGVLQSVGTKTDSWSFEANTKIASRGTTYYFDGLIDEIRISNMIRDAGWIKTTYDSEIDALITYGDEETADFQKMILTGTATLR